MGLADPDLRKGRAIAGAVVHLLAPRRILGDIELGEGGLFAGQQRLGCGAIAAARPGVDLDSGAHLAWRSHFTNDLNYMGRYRVSTTRANTSASTWAALARKSARAQASSVAPEVRTSSIRTMRGPARRIGGRQI